VKSGSEARKRRLAHAVREYWPLRLALKVAAAILAPRQPAGAVGVLFNDRGQVLIVEHVLRTDFPWGLPGGWIERGEAPEHAVAREFEEELGLSIEVGALLHSEPIGLVHKSTHPRHLGLAYVCRWKGGAVRLTTEVISAEWVDPHAIPRTLAPFQRKVIELAAARRATVDERGGHSAPL
jgi:8-oxo-dGTP diphosphatase